MFKVTELSLYMKKDDKLRKTEIESQIPIFIENSISFSRLIQKRKKLQDERKRKNSQPKRLKNCFQATFTFHYHSGVF